MILTLNDGKLIVNIPVSKDGSNWFTNERNMALNKTSYKYFKPFGSYVGFGPSMWHNLPGQEVDENRKFDFDSLNNPVAYFYENYPKPKIENYSLIKPFVSKFLIYGTNELQSIELEDMIIDHESFSKPYDEIDFILTCKDAKIKKDLLYDRHKEFADMYYDIIPNIELKPISEYSISNLENNEDNEYKIETAKENNRVLKLLRK